jgi:hypothetical protein
VVALPPPGRAELELLGVDVRADRLTLFRREYALGGIERGEQPLRNGSDIAFSYAPSIASHTVERSIRFAWTPTCAPVACPASARQCGPV